MQKIALERLARTQHRLLNGDRAQFVNFLTEIAPEDDFTPEDLGWLYQYFNRPEKDRAIKIKTPTTPEDLPFVTQIFTPDWVTNYLIDHSLGAYRQSHPDVKIDQITLIDPCAGTGHILLSAYRKFREFYLKTGLPPREIPAKILQNNLYGLDIDEKALSIASLALLKLAKKDDPDIFRHPPLLNLHALSGVGSLSELGDALLSRSYTLAVTNPPYLDENRYHPELKAYILKNYPTAKSNLAVSFIERCLKFVQTDGIVAMLTPESWLFLSGANAFRTKLLQTASITHLIHLGNGVFSDQNNTSVAVAAFALEKTPNKPGAFIRATKGTSRAKEELVRSASKSSDHPCKFQKSAIDFQRLPGQIIAYWAPKNLPEILKTAKPLKTFADPRQGVATGDNAEYVRAWWEVPLNQARLCSTSRADALETLKNGKIWFPYNKGGTYRKWYGNNDFVIKFDPEAQEKLLKTGNHLPSRDLYFEPCLTWSKIAFELAFRYRPAGSVFDVAGTSMFSPDADTLAYLQGLLNSKPLAEIAKILSPTVNFEVGQVKNYPIIVDDAKKPEIIKLVRLCRKISREDWDDRETSWDFATHPLLKTKQPSLKTAYNSYARLCRRRLKTLKSAEERLNALAIEIYHYGTITPDVPEEALTITRPTPDAVTRSFLSYFIGCTLGRYNLEKPGVQPTSNYQIPPASEISALLYNFLKTAFPNSKPKENLAWLAENLGQKPHETPEEAIKNYFETDFEKDHAKTYTAGQGRGKRVAPIYKTTQEKPPLL